MEPLTPVEDDDTDELLAYAREVADRARAKAERLREQERAAAKA